MILAGYLIIFAYIFFLVIVVGSILNKYFNVEISRKVIHTGLFIVWVFIDIFLKNTIHQVIIPIIFIIVNYLSYKFKIFKNMEREDENQPGTVYFSIGITIIMETMGETTGTGTMRGTITLVANTRQRRRTGGTSRIQRQGPWSRRRP